MKKLGPHIQVDTGAAYPWARRASIVKSMDSVRAFHVAPPTAIRIFRHYFPQQDLNDHAPPIATTISAALAGYRHPRLYVEMWNEAHQRVGSGLEEHADKLQTVAQLLRSDGIKVGGPCWSTGEYEREDWEYMRDRKWCGMSAIILHAYWANQGFTPWNALRFAEYWRPGDPPVIVSECGRDRVKDIEAEQEEDRWDGEGGWKADGISAEAYVRELVDYDIALQRLAYVWGGTPFTADPNVAWRDYSTDELVDAIVATYDKEDKMEPFAARWPVEYERWKRGGGVSDVDFLAWMVATQNYRPTPEELRLIANTHKGNIEALVQALATALHIGELPNP